MAQYMRDYDHCPSPPALPVYTYQRADLERWDTKPLPPGLVFSENAVAITESIITPAIGEQLIRDFHETGEHVNAPDTLISYLDNQVRETGGWRFMLDPRTSVFSFALQC